MSSERILVTGPTGNVGSGLVQSLCESGASVRAIVHSESKAKAVMELGAEAVVDNLDEPRHLRDALAGIESIYLLTTNGYNALKQVESVIRAARESDSPRIVRQSGYGSPKSRIIEQHLKAEAEVKASGLPYTIVRPTFFMQNTMMAAQTIVSQGAIYMPFKNGRVGMVDARDVTDVAARVLTSEGHEGKEYTLTGPASISFNDISSTLSKVLNRDVSYTDVPLDAGKEAMVGMGIPDWIADGFLELIAEFV